MGTAVSPAAVRDGKVQLTWTVDNNSTRQEQVALFNRVYPQNQVNVDDANRDISKVIVQAIGGVNEKIEGFFDLCARRGLTGEQGVLIPVSNVPHLMLRKDVVAAAAAGRSRVHAVTTIDEGIALLTGLPAGERDTGGHFPEGSVNARVEARLQAFAETARAAGRAGENHKEGA